jgi:hypothetical protein
MTFRAQNFICDSAVSHPVEMGLQLLSLKGSFYTCLCICLICWCHYLLFIALVPYDLSYIIHEFQAVIKYICYHYINIFTYTVYDLSLTHDTVLSLCIYTVVNTFVLLMKYMGFLFFSNLKLQIYHMFFQM